MKKWVNGLSILFISLLVIGCEVTDNFEKRQIAPQNELHATALATPATGSIHLKARANGKYVCADNGGSSPLIAVKTAASLWETFTLVRNNDGTYSFLAQVNNLYVCADNYGLNPLIANRTNASGWESFVIYQNGDGSYSFLSKANNQYVCADNAGAKALIANRNSASTWESFDIEYVETGSSTSSSMDFSSASSIASQTSFNSSSSASLTSSSQGGVTLRLQMVNGTTGANDNTISPRYRLFNTGTQPADLSKVSIRYFYTINGDKPQSFWCDWSQAGTANVSGTFNKWANPVQGADYTLAIGFTAASGYLSASSTLDVQCRFAKNDWSAYFQTDDFSFNPASSAFIDWIKSAVYYDGVRIWGNVPGEDSHSSSSLKSSSSSSSSSSSYDIEAKVEALLKQMTLDEKIGQMMQPNWGSIANDADVYQYGFGSILNGGGESPASNNPTAWADLYEKYQKLALQSRLHIPLIWGTDAVHGDNNVKGATIFPHNIGLGATRDTALVELVARTTALEMLATGINWTFAPCVAVVRDERWGRTYEGFGEDPDLVTSMGAAAIRGYQQSVLSNRYSVLACAKHYMGDGGTAGGTNAANTISDEATFRQIHLKPYYEAINNKVDSIMVSYSSWNGVKMHENKYLLTDVLKGELGFKGFLISDWAAIKYLSGSVSDQIRKSINAGLDMIMLPDYYQTFLTTTRDLVNQGQIPLSRIDDAVRRILRVKYRLGLFDHSMAVRELIPQVGSSANRAIARTAVQKSLVLLKNQGVLPIAQSNIRIVVAGSKANDLGAQCGGWTISWQGSLGNITTGTTILQGIQNAAGQNTVVDYSINGSSAAGHDVAIVVVGETPYAETDGDNFTLELSDSDKQTISQVQASGVPMVVVLLSGRPLMIQNQINQANAWIAAWLPGTEGDGVADILFGKVKPTGKLPCTWPRDISQIPINAGDGKTNPLFAYGFGLTY